MIRRIEEDLNQIQKEPTTDTSEASAQAKKLRLVYVGFGRYVDPKTGQVSHIVLNGKLTPFNKATKTNTFKQLNSDDYGLYNQLMQPQLDEYHSTLVQGYPPENFDDRELTAIQQFTGGSSIDVNNRLATLPVGASVNKLEPQMLNDPIPDMIKYLDSATKKHRAPINFKTYIKLPDSPSVDEISSGSTLRFKGFRSSTLSVGALLASVQPDTTGVRPSVRLLQVEVPKNSRGLYASDYSVAPEEHEFIMSRGSKIEISSDFKALVGSDALSGNLNLEVLYADCTLKQ